MDASTYEDYPTGVPKIEEGLLIIDDDPFFSSDRTGAVARAKDTLTDRV